jgi:hypothetical protein
MQHPPMQYKTEISMLSDFHGISTDQVVHAIITDWMLSNRTAIREVTFAYQSLTRKMSQLL